MQKFRILFMLSIIVVISFSLAACSTADDSAQTGSSGDVDAVTLQFDWIHTVEYSPFYVADSNGYFSDNNLEIAYSLPDGESNSIERLINGDVDFAITGSDSLFLAREQGEDIVAIANIYQLLPVGFMSLAEDNIVVPEDLLGQTVMISLNRTPEYAFRAMLSSVGLDISEINIVPRNVFTEEPLLNGEVDASDVFVTNQPVQMRREGIEINLIMPLDYGVEMYVNTVVTTREMIDENPDLVARFVDAMVQGIQSSVEDAEQATQLTLEINPDLDYDSELESMQTSLPLLLPAGSEPGEMNPETWQYVHDMLLNQGILTESQDVEAAYDMSFLNQAHGESE